MTTLDTSKLKLIEGDYTPSSDFEYEIAENGGFFAPDQIATYDNNGVKMDIVYSICVSGYTVTDRGDWMTPPYTFTEISDVDITIKEVRVEDSLIETTSDMDKVFEKLVETTI